MFEKTYHNKAGKSFTEGRKFRISEFLDYYNTLTDEEWDAAIEMAAKKGYDISNVKAYIRVYGKNPGFEPMNLEEVCEQLLEIYGQNEGMSSTCIGSVPIEEERRNMEEFYASMGLPVPEYWRVRLWR